MMSQPKKDRGSFSDDDLQFIGSQARSQPDALFEQRGLNGTREVIDITSSPISKSAASPEHQRFGHPTELFNHLKAKAKVKLPNVFLQRKHHPEHHRDGPSSHTRPGRPASNAIFGGGSSGPADDARLPLYSTKGTDVTHVQYAKPATGYPDEVFYTDPAKAQSDLKDLLAGGMEDDEEDDAAQKIERLEGLDAGEMDGISVKLLPHQVEGVKWMKGRELGPVKRGKVPKGGILADDMGLGKTLQSIALIISNPMPKQGDKGWKKNFDQIKPVILVVAPLSLIRQWEQEIKEKVTSSHTLKVYVHHGPQRAKDPKELTKYDVVITTYQILVSEHGNSNPDPTGVPQVGCFGVHWYRVFLDEAHSIKNRNAKASKACYSLRSEYRWCLTGTPMQNNLDELQSLVRFLRIRPYDNLAEWRAHIDQPMKNGKGHIAIRRLQSLLQCFMKRRTKDILKEEGALNPGGKRALDAAKLLAKANGTDQTTTPTPAFKIVERKVVPISTEFSEPEQDFYDQLEARAGKSLKRMMNESHVNYANALVLLLRLRQACNHPDLVKASLEKDSEALSSDTLPHNSASGSNGDVDDLTMALGGLGIGAKRCDMCMADLGPADGARCSACIKSLDLVGPFGKPRSKHQDRKSLKEAKPATTKNTRRRNRRIIMDDSDEDEEDADWIVPEGQRGALHLGVAGGEADENAEGGGEWIASDDSSHSSEDDDDDDSRLSNFVDYDDDGVPTSHSHGQSRGPGSRLDEPAAENNHGIDPSSYTVKGPRGSKIIASAKIRELIRILQKEVPEHKFIVFSQFTSMLDLIQPFFDNQPGFKYARYDGKMKHDDREAALNALRNDKHTRILLCSLKCGSLGLNLTAATRVVILEPFWNPFVEEQAIDRVHRLTQTVDVVVYKLTVAGTVEERILELQEKKRLLAESALEGGKKKDAMKLRLEDILKLFRHDDRDRTEQTRDRAAR